jgi:hypothetical protein
MSSLFPPKADDRRLLSRKTYRVEKTLKTGVEGLQLSVLSEIQAVQDPFTAVR